MTMTMTITVVIILLLIVTLLNLYWGQAYANLQNKQEKLQGRPTYPRLANTLSTGYRALPYPCQLPIHETVSLQSTQ